jgi:type I site-specific restriction endonuclease
MNGQNEAFSRILIDKALEFSGWNLLDGKQVQFELHTSNGRADYLLKDKLGRVLCVLEAKREDLDPYDAKDQARGYAENLKAPFVILSNGREHWFWNFERADQRDAIACASGAASGARIAKGICRACGGNPRAGSRASCQPDPIGRSVSIDAASGV